MLTIRRAMRKRLQPISKVQRFTIGFMNFFLRKISKLMPLSTCFSGSSRPPISYLCFRKNRFRLARKSRKKIKIRANGDGKGFGRKKMIRKNRKRESSVYPI